MKISELQEKIGLKPFNKLYDKEIEGVFISDMVSDIVAGAKANDVLLTIQTHKNLIATANLVDISAIVLMRGKSPLPDVIELADRAEITIFGSDLDAYKIAIKLHDLGIE